METCVITGCDRAKRSRGMCHKHYSRWLRNGDALIDGMAVWSAEKRAKRAEYAKTATEKECTKCRKVKPMSDYYRRGDWFYSWCKTCHNDMRRAKVLQDRLDNPKPKPEKVDHGLCSFDGCPNKGKAQLVQKNGPEGWYCPAHWSQWDKTQSLKPLKHTEKSYIDDRFRRCTTCEKVKTQESFNFRSDRAGRQSECKDCNYLRARFNLLMREGGREDEVQELYERMPVKMQDKMKARLDAA